MKPGNDDAPNQFLVFIDTSIPGAHEPAAPRHVAHERGAMRIIHQPSGSSTAVYVACCPLVLCSQVCRLDDDALASAALFRRRCHIPQASLGAAPTPYAPPRPPRNHAGTTRRDGEMETASWRRDGAVFVVVLSSQQGGGRRGELK